MDEKHKAIMYKQLTNFIIVASKQKRLKTFCYQMLVSKAISPMEYWLTDGREWPLLHQIALRVPILCLAAHAELSY